MKLLADCARCTGTGCASRDLCVRHLMRETGVERHTPFIQSPEVDEHGCCIHYLDIDPSHRPRGAADKDPLPH